MDVRTQQCMHAITALQGVAVVMLLWLLTGSRAKVEDLCGNISHSLVLGSSALSFKLVRHFSDCSDSELKFKNSLHTQHYTVTYDYVVGEVWDKCDTEIKL